VKFTALLEGQSIPYSSRAMRPTFRVLALDVKGNLIAGPTAVASYRISPSGEAFYLTSAPKKEITALALDGAGNIYAAGVGESVRARSMMPGF
jgi:hypothetical protein